MVACDYVSVSYQRGGDGFLKERDSRGRVWSAAFMRRYVELTPAIPLVAANPGVKVLATRFALAASDEELRRTAFFREIMQRQGWRHGAVLCFWAEPAGTFPVCVLTLYRTQGMRQRIGFGERPAVLIIDMQHDFCDADAATTLWPSIQSTYDPIRQLCTAARARRIPVFYTQGLVAADGSSAGLWRLKMRAHAHSQVQVVGTKGAEIIPELKPEPSDHVIRKWRPSALFRTDFEVFLKRFVAAGLFEVLAHLVIHVPLEGEQAVLPEAIAMNSDAGGGRDGYRRAESFELRT